MQPVDVGRPLRGPMSQERGAVVLQIRRQLYAQRVLDLGDCSSTPSIAAVRSATVNASLTRYGGTHCYVEIGVEEPSKMV